jgi:hypothetical protein
LILIFSLYKKKVKKFWTKFNQKQLISCRPK